MIVSQVMLISELHLQARIDEAVGGNKHWLSDIVIGLVRALFFFLTTECIVDSLVCAHAAHVDPWRRR